MYGDYLRRILGVVTIAQMGLGFLKMLKLYLGPKSQ